MTRLSYRLFWNGAILLERRVGRPISGRDTWRRAVGGALLLMLATASAAAEGPTRDLRDVPANRQVMVVTLCRGHYDITFEDGSHLQFAEYNLAFRMDTSALGPPFAVLVVSRRRPERAAVVFPSVPALMAIVNRDC